ncbi:MAG TPA: hypothetical protein VF046_06200 [Gemmatimonadales bacterium]
MVPFHTVAFAQQKLRSAVRRASSQHQNLHYGFVIHARRRGARNALGVITLSGESLALTPRLLEGLEGRTLRLFGTAPIQLSAGTTIGSDLELRAKADLALASVMMHVDGVSDAAAQGHVVEVEAAVMADALAQPLVVLTTERPETWPL